MANTYTKNSGMISPADCRTLMDNFAKVVKNAYPKLGINLPTESSTLAATAATARENIFGDGSTVYGIANATYLDSVASALGTTPANLRADLYLGSLYRTALNALNTQISSNLPTGWTFVVGSVMQYAFDAWLLRCNGLSGPANSIAPTNAITVTGGNSSDGALPNVSSGNAPRVVYTLVGDQSWKESLPVAVAGFDQLTGNENAYTITIAGTPPTATGTVRLYRTKFGDPSGTKYYVKQYAWSGSVWPASMVLTEPDHKLRQDIEPPSWAQCLAPDDFAALWAWAFGSVPSGVTSDYFPLTLASLTQLSPANIANGPAVDTNLATKALGGYNPESSVLYGTFNSSYTQGGLQTTNSPTYGLQGFAGSMGIAGAGGIRARVTSTLSGSIASGDIAITYTYYSATNGWGSIQTQAGVNPTGTLSTAAGSLATFNVPAGRIVRAVTACAVTGAPTGEFVLEGTEVRSY